MEVTIAGSPGWSETGGTWVTPEHAMMKYVWSETRIDGGTPLAAVNLALPPSTTGPFLGVSATRRGAPPSNLTHDVYQDALVVAFPTPPADLAVFGAVYTSSAGPIDLALLRVSDLAHSVALPVQPGEASVWIQASFPQPVTIASIILGLSAPAAVDIEASDDGRSFHTLRHVEPDGAEHPCPQQTYAFSPITGRFFRVVLRNPPPAPPLPGLPSAFLRPPQPFTAFEITRLAFTGSSRVDRFESKAGFTSDYTEDTDTARLWSGGALAPKALLHLVHVNDGRLVTPSGMSYRVLYLPANVKRLTLPVLQKLRDLVASGAILIAPKPESGLGLASDDDAIRAIADELWTDASRSPVGSVFGKGRVYQWTDLLQLLQAVRVSPDVTFAGAAPAPKIMTLHRHLDGSDIYFLSNRDSVPRTLDATFRVKGMAPQLWHADTGTIEDVDYASTSRGTRVPLQLAADEALFSSSSTNPPNRVSPFQRLTTRRCCSSTARGVYVLNRVAARRKR